MYRNLIQCKTKGILEYLSKKKYIRVTLKLYVQPRLPSCVTRKSYAIQQVFTL